MAACFVFSACAFFVIFVFIMIFRCRKKNHSGRQKSNPASLMIVVGSGGHTKEILLLMGQLGQHYNPRHYVIAASDSISLQKVHNSEKCNCLTSVKYFVHTIPRSREVKQSWVTTVFTTLYASILCLPLVFRVRPEIILCNGPGTCIPVCIAGLLLKAVEGVHQTGATGFTPFRQPSCPPPQTHCETVGIPQKQSKTENIVKMKSLMQLLGEESENKMVWIEGHKDCLC